MNRHKLTYVDLHPEALGREKAPPLWAQALGVIFAAAFLYISIVFLFTL